MTFEEWIDKNFDELVCIAAETGQDRELGFDWEQFVLREYDKYRTRKFLDYTHDSFMKIFNEAPDRNLPEGVLAGPVKRRKP